MHTQSDARQRAEFAVHLRPLESHVELLLHLEPRQSTSLRARRHRVKELLTTITNYGPDWAYVPYADGVAQAAAIESLLHGSGPFRRTPIEAQIMRGKYAYPPQSSWGLLSGMANRWLTERNPWHVTHILDPWALAALNLPATNCDRFRLIPEPVDALPQIGRDEARRALGIPVDGRYIAMLGGMELRKGIEQFLAAFAAAKLADDDRTIGRQSNKSDPRSDPESLWRISSARTDRLRRPLRDGTRICLRIHCG